MELHNQGMALWLSVAYVLVLLLLTTFVNRRVLKYTMADSYARAHRLVRWYAFCVTPILFSAVVIVGTLLLGPEL
ncbi:hypothetical protein FBPa45_0015 [Pseudomonas phage vB_PaeS_FBPa45]|nr:hypothetical protein FBPa45_0015 [Pseudomonas phage vB_PaeS_FBPa45]